MLLNYHYYFCFHLFVTLVYLLDCMVCGKCPDKQADRKLQFVIVCCIGLLHLFVCLSRKCVCCTCLLCLFVCWILQCMANVQTRQTGRCSLTLAPSGGKKLTHYSHSILRTNTEEFTLLNVVLLKGGRHWCGAARTATRLDANIFFQIAFEKYNWRGSLYE